MNTTSSAAVDTTLTITRPDDWHLHLRDGAALAAVERLGQRLDAPPPTTTMGALVHHIIGGAEAKTFQPMNVNFGLFPPIDAKGGRKGRKDRYKAYTDRAKGDFQQWLGA